MDRGLDVRSTGIAGDRGANIGSLDRGGNARGGETRVALLQAALLEAPLDTIVGVVPSAVLMMTGYWSVMGLSLAIVNQDGTDRARGADRRRSAGPRGWAHEVATFEMDR